MFDGPHREESLFGHMFTAHPNMHGHLQMPAAAPSGPTVPRMTTSVKTAEAGLRVPVETSNRSATATHPPPGKEGGNRQGAKKRRRARQSEQRPNAGCIGAVGAVPLPHPTRPPASGLNLCKCGEQIEYGVRCFDCFVVHDMTCTIAPVRPRPEQPAGGQGTRPPPGPHQVTPGYARTEDVLLPQDVL